MLFSVGFINLGCAKNLVDSQVMAGFLKRGAIALAPSPEQADLILVNTCGFIETAREESAEAILSACEYKKQGGCRAVVVTGCMVERYRQRMFDAFPDVDAFIGVDELEQIEGVVRKISRGESPGLLVRKGKSVKLFNPHYPTLLFTGGPFAYIKIAEGCNHRCAYCAIPGIRGNFRSRSIDAILAEVEHMVSAGVSELNLIAQDTFNYGTDLPGNATLLHLIRRIDTIKGKFRFRVLYGYPAGIDSELLEFMNLAEHLCRYLDIPVQHSHPAILRAMNRGVAVKSVEGLGERLRSAVPGVVLRTTCLVGFPGESEEHFAHLMEYVAQNSFDHLGVFGFSAEEGTPADEMDGTVPDELIEERCGMLMELQSTIAERKNRALVGQKDEVLLLGKTTEGQWIGRLPRQAPDVDGVTIVSGVPEGSSVGEFIRVIITGFEGYDLQAHVATGADR